VRTSERVAAPSKLTAAALPDVAKRASFALAGVRVAGGGPSASRGVNCAQLASGAVMMGGRECVGAGRALGRFVARAGGD
jgi:hypothetical protein